MNNRKTVVDISEMLAGLEKLDGAKESIGRTMGLAMGVEVRDEAKVRAPVLEPGTQGTDGQVAGTLRDAIYVAYDDRRAVLTPGTFTYTVSWNSKKAPHGHLLEFGHWMPYYWAQNAQGQFYTPIPSATKRGKQKGILRDDPLWVKQHPFLGPAFDAKLPRLASIAFQAGTVRFQELMK